MEPLTNNNGLVTLINVFEVPAGQLDETISFWTQARDFLSGQPGFMSTALQQAISPESRFQLINVAQWESPEAYASATQAMREQSGLRPPTGLVFHPGLYRTCRT